MGPTEKWNDFLWGTDVWLGPQSIYLQFFKGVVEAITVSDAWNKMLVKGVPNAIGIAGVVTKEFDKYIADAIGVADVTSKQVAKLIANNVALADVTTKFLTKLLTNAIAVSDDITANQQKGIWDIVFPGGTTDATEQSVPVYTEQADPSTIWSSSTAGPTTWTEV